MEPVEDPAPLPGEPASEPPDPDDVAPDEPVDPQPPDEGDQSSAGAPEPVEGD